MLILEIKQTIITTILVFLDDIKHIDSWINLDSRVKI